VLELNFEVIAIYLYQALILLIVIEYTIFIQNLTVTLINAIS